VKDNPNVFCLWLYGIEAVVATSSRNFDKRLSGVWHVKNYSTDISLV
jgi:hypothetical protein